MIIIPTKTVTTAITKHWLCAKHHSRYFTCITYILFNPLYGGEIWGSGRLSHLPMFTWLISKEIRIQTPNPRSPTSGFSTEDAHQNLQGRYLEIYMSGTPFPEDFDSASVGGVQASILTHKAPQVFYVHGLSTEPLPYALLLNEWILEWTGYHKVKWANFSH